MAGADAEASAVARADNLVPLDRTACEDASVVGADVLDGVVATLQVEDRNLCAVHFHHAVGTRRELGRRTDGDPITHAARNACFVAPHRQEKGQRT